MKSFVFLLLLFAQFACGPRKEKPVVVEEVLDTLTVSGPPTLSGYGFFKGALKNLEPAEDVIPYTINSALFSDYAFKARFIRLPESKAIHFHATETFEFPEGTVLIKNFYYPADFRQSDEKLRLLETRLLTLHEGNWEPLTYIWNDEQTEAYLEVSGRAIPVSWVHTDGSVKSIDYSVPNVNQCRGCHLKGDRVMPIGPSARQLHREDQLSRWVSAGLLTEVPTTGIPQMVSYDDEQAPIADRARAWLEVNCAHCHRPDGQGKSSGLHLSADVGSELALGVGKAPVAAGKGSGGRRYSIVPGKPDESILLYRIESTDPAIMMPEMGRKLVHEEGVELVRKWILAMK
jgi:uncharacterized repeat protein (TIGR03806 family)